ncbi:ArsO family NAD(P)H-dependent flavin-containing monooxygenase [Nocardioides jishulii]|uniref:NAD(P)/FAD-dependent oxidoreductase n=1 Tax=Nocardioides jishulii TaxID=2575440 RepID=A0A4U2YNP7_9ACTN|nr:ArsO family NAD(P)H-dependent flavin-containing monooxygenase [Nocardioides jishulii]QCX27677.1 NAD(P)/FAD-dependent oxidoreductase [Nocardioides jishulii]TKI62484.1 NAD(P)/FAD-dependent oxidoreductase [Nocardioides jishulii]
MVDNVDAIPVRGASDVEVDVVVVGAGQAGLSTAFYLRRAGLVPGRDFVMLDAAERPGGAWPRTWDGLRLFSPAGFSSLPGWMMPPWDDATRGFPTRDHVVDYLTRYEERYDLRVQRPQRVESVSRADDSPDGRLHVATGDRTLSARHVVSATGTWDRPFWPVYPGMRDFVGRQLHTVDYRVPDAFAGQRVVVVGGGNSAAQILAEISTVADTTWVTTRPPRFLPDDVDGRALFTTARARIEALAEGREHSGVAGLGDIVMVPSVKGARDRGVLRAEPMFSRLTLGGVAWGDGTEWECDAIIWCTGFRPALRHLRPLGLRTVGGHVPVAGPSGTQARDEPRLYLVGYGDWTGPASATLAGVGPSARATVAAIAES